MPEMTIEIGGRTFRIVCQPGEEVQLQRAAKLLAAEADALQDAIGRVPEARMLLMAGLMVADKAVAAAEGMEDADARARQMQDQVRQVEAKAAKLATSALHTDDSASDELVARLTEERDQARADHKAALDALQRAVAAVEALAASAD